MREVAISVGVGCAATVTVVCDVKRSMTRLRGPVASRRYPTMFFCFSRAIGYKPVYKSTPEA